MLRSSLVFLATLSLLPTAPAQRAVSQLQPIASTKPEMSLPGPAAPKPIVTTPADPNTFTPTWETQKGARTYMLGIPAPRGQILDRNGLPLAQMRVSYNLGIVFPTPLNFSERQVLSFAQDQVLLARKLTGRPISLTQEQVLKHYKNRGAVPLIMAQAQDLKAAELQNVRANKSETLSLQPVYQRIYPNGNLACHVIGYAGRSGRMPDGPIENNELLWPNAEGRDGLELSFDEQLQGKVGQYNISFDASGKKATEQVTIPPQPGYNVVTTIDLELQRLCEESLAKGVKRGALVVLDPTSGDVLAMASWPTFNPNLFVPMISQETYDQLRNDPQNPLIPRAFRSAYPPGSTYKVFVGLAALQSGKIRPGDEFGCPPSYSIGNLTFRNHKKRDMGFMNFAGALTQSCNTWFYQVGLRIGAAPIIDASLRLGLGARTGIPLESEAAGRVPDDEYMLKVHKRRILNGDIANLSIGQGDLLISPLQMAQAMGAVGNGGTLYQTRLVQQVQSIDNQIISAYNIRARSQVEIDPTVMKTIRTGMVQVVSSSLGTASRASVPGVQVAGKTGTAQWGPKNNERTVAWFAGFAPADKPRYAFAAVYEGDAKNHDVHGGTEAAPIVGRVLKELFKDAAPQKKKTKGKKKAAEEPMDDDDVEVRRAEPVNPEDIP